MVVYGGCRHRTVLETMNVFTGQKIEKVSHKSKVPYSMQVTTLNSIRFTVRFLASVHECLTSDAKHVATLQL